MQSNHEKKNSGVKRSNIMINDGKFEINVAGFVRKVMKSIFPGKPVKLMGIEVSNKTLKGIFNILRTLSSDDWIYTNIDFEVVRYKSLSSDMKTPCELSGLVIKPQFRNDAPHPILAYQHWTQLEKWLAPSCFSTKESHNFVEVLVAMFMAVHGGFNIVMADYQGMGKCGIENNKEMIQPYMAAEPLARSIVDLVAHIKNNRIINWNDHLYMIGYSQGGYATMAAARELQENPLYKDIKVDACAPCAGPYSLSEVMLKIIIDQKPSKFNHFFPMVIRGFNARYGEEYGDGIFTKDKAFKAKYKYLFDLVDGFHTLDQVMSSMPSQLQEVLSDDLLEQLESRSGPGYDALVNNDDYKWDPKMPMYMYQCPYDDIVPYDNSIQAEKYFDATKSSVPLVPMFNLPLKHYVHIEAALPCMMSAYTWIKTLTPGI